MGTQFALAIDRTMMGPLVLRIIWAGEVKGEPELIITLPANTNREDFERMRTEIQAAMDQAERRGEQKALAFLSGWGIPPILGVLRQKDTPHTDAILQVIERFEELLSEHPELTRGQAYIRAVMEAGEKWIAGEGGG